MTKNQIKIKLSEIKLKVNNYKLQPEVRALFDALILLFEILLLKSSANSKNSSVPPSQDPNRVKTRKSTNRKTGGQLGHKGFTLELDPNPTEIIPLAIDRRKIPNNTTYKKAKPEIRQVKDFSVEITVTEYQAEVLIDENGKRYVADFPENVTKAIQYGSGIKANAVYMANFQMVSLDRIEENFSDQLNVKLSDSSVFNFSKELYLKLAKWDDNIKLKLITEELLHADETGINVNGDKFWLHALCNKQFTWFEVHKNRGKDAMDQMGVLPYFKGYLCHDHWKAYFMYFCHHILCNAHHLRELTYIEEEENQKWAMIMKKFLLDLNKEVYKKGGKIGNKRQAEVIKRYREILEKGEKECPINLIKSGKRGKTKQSKSRNLLDRFKEYEKEILSFMKNPLIPFTNNQGENDLRMTKVKLKVAGCFRSTLGAQIFARIRGFINTCKKNNINVSWALKEVFDGNLGDIIKKVL